MMIRFPDPKYALSLVALLLAGLLGFSVVGHMSAISKGKEILIPAQGYDPRALLLGHYVMLTPELEVDLSAEQFANIQDEAQLTSDYGGEISGWTVLEQSSAGWQIKQITASQPVVETNDDLLILKGPVHIRKDYPATEPPTYTARPILNIRRYYTNRSEAELIQKELRDPESEVMLIVSVSKNGQPMLKGVQINDERIVMGWW